MHFRTIVSAIFEKIHSNPCGYLLIIRNLANNNCTGCGEAVVFLASCLFLAACYFEGKNSTLPLLEFYK